MCLSCTQHLPSACFTRPAWRVSVCVQAAWQLATWLSLPWKPYVEIEGRTVYTLNAGGNQVCVYTVCDVLWGGSNTLCAWPVQGLNSAAVWCRACFHAQIVRHEEFWNVSPVAALLMMFRPGPPIPASSK